MLELIVFMKWLLFDFAARRLPPHVFAPALLAHPPPEAVAQDAQTPIPALRTFCIAVELKVERQYWNK
jgi:hypothetical protein